MLGVVQATSVMRTLQIGDRPTKLAQAVAELGRIDKTIHALTYIDDESKRRRILNQLNKGEDRHKLARAVFHGKQGELRQRYREGQENQLGALGLCLSKRILEFSFVEASRHALTQILVEEPIKGKKRPFDTSKFSQCHCQAILSRVACQFSQD
jgi:TnpA family transposase